MTAPTLEEIANAAEQGLREVLDPGATGAVNLRPGSRNSALVSAVTQVGTRLVAHATERAAATRVSTATGDDLDQIASDDYETERLPATRAVGTVYLVRSSAAAATVIPRGSRFAASAGVVFEATQDVSAGVAVGSQRVAVPVQALTEGTQGNVALATITTIVDALPDQTWSLYVPTLFDALYPPDVIGGGSARETDDELRARLLDVSPDDTRAPGSLPAVRHGARTVPGVRDVLVIEPGNGTLAVIAGDAGYALPAAMRRAIELELRRWRAHGVPALVRGFDVRVVSVVATVHMARAVSQYDGGAIATAARARIHEYFAAREHPDEVFADAIVSALHRAHEDVQHATVSLSDSLGSFTERRRPASDAAYAFGAVPRFVVTDATLSIVVADPARTP